MTYDFTQIHASKRKFRQTLAASDITEKLHMLDVLRERALVLRASPSSTGEADTVREDTPPYPSTNSSNPS